jgi:23S rRNA pseudouridine1911/1915/1917 synthase
MTGYPLKHSKTIISTTAEAGIDIYNITDDLLDVLGNEAEEGVAVDLQSFEVDIEAHGQRLDIALTARLGSFSRSYVQQRIDAGDVTLNQRVVTKTSGKVVAGDKIVIALRETLQSQAFKPQDLAIHVIFEDAHLLVVDKPAGLVVHPAPGNWQGTLLNGLLFRDPSVVNLPRAGIVHRLDKDTSGLMVVAKTRTTMDALVKMIADRDVHREYLALSGKPWTGPQDRQVNSPIGRDPHNRIRMAVVDLGRNSGKQAKTDFHSLDSTEKGCVVQCTLHTGRTHQIRVHMHAVGHPLLGDTIYGGLNGFGIERQALHAFRLSFKHPITGKKQLFTSAVPADFRQAAALMGLQYNPAAPRDGAMANE